MHFVGTWETVEGVQMSVYTHGGQRWGYTGMCAQPGVGDRCKSVHTEAGVKCVVGVCVCACMCRCGDLEERGRVAHSVCTLGGERQAGIVSVGVFEQVHMCVHRKERRSGVCSCGCSEETVCARAAPCPPGAHLFLPSPRSPCPRPASAQVLSLLDGRCGPGPHRQVARAKWSLSPGDVTPAVHQQQGQGRRGVGAKSRVHGAQRTSAWMHPQVLSPYTQPGTVSQFNHFQPASLASHSSLELLTLN